MIRTAPSRAARLETVLATWILNVALGTVVAWSYLASAPSPPSIKVWLFMHAALLSSVATLAFVVALVLLVLAGMVANLRAIAWTQAVLWTLFQLVLFADTRIYGLFRYHFNPLVWNVMTTPGAEDAVYIGAGTWTIVAVAGVIVCALELRAWTWLARRRAAREPSRRTALAPTSAGALALLGVVLFEKAVYAHADLKRERDITALASLYPLYQRLTVNRIAERWFGVELEKRPKVALGGEGMLLRYPLEPPRIDPAGPRPNILIVVIDSLRADVLEPRAMPRMSAFAERARRFDNHVSGGNATRFGIFSLVYGLHGFYWKPVRDEQQPPVLVTTLADLGYEMSVLSSASMNFPEFRSTAWVTIEDRVEDQLEGAKHERDVEVARRFEARLAEREGRADAAPFFTFALLDSTHQSYSVPPGPQPFEPSADDVDYLALSRASGPASEDVVRLKNRFLNAVHHADSVAGAMIDALERHGELARTIVVVTGDHGEEFYEHGFFGHTSNFTPVQVRVAFLMSGPGIPIGVETRPTTHVDLVPTILELLGADPASRAGYSQGASLLAPAAVRARILAGWDDVALWVDGGILHVPLEGHRGSIEAFDDAWKRIDEGPLCARNGPLLRELAQETRRFLR